MARSRGKGRAAAPPRTSPGGLFDLPFPLLEAILKLLPLKLRVRFSTTCRAARQLASASPCLFPTVFATCRSRMQSLALLRWLGSGGRGPFAMNIQLSVQQVPIVRQLGQGLGMQGARLKLLLLQVHDGPLVLTGSCLSCLVRLHLLHVEASSIELGSSCGHLAALRVLHVCCGSDDFWEPRVMLREPCTVTVQPGAIPPGLTTIHFVCCAMPELPAALCAAAGLRELCLARCAVRLDYIGAAGPLLGPTLGSLTALETLQLRRLHLEEQPSVPALVAGFTRLRHLDLSESLLCEGGERVLCNAFPQLSSLTFLSIGGLSSAGNLQALPSSLPALRELRLVLPPHCEDQRLPALAAAPQLQSLMVCGSTLLCEDNVQLLKTLPELRGLAVMLPHTDEMWEQVDESGARRLVDAIASLPALEYVVLLFGSREMSADECFASIRPGLEDRSLRVVSLSRRLSVLIPDVWPVNRSSL